MYIDDVMLFIKMIPMQIMCWIHKSRTRKSSKKDEKINIIYLYRVRFYAKEHVFYGL